MTADAEPVETVARIAMTIVSAEPTPEAEERWARRAEILAAWLVAAWRLEQARLEESVVPEFGLN